MVWIKRCFPLTLTPGITNEPKRRHADQRRLETTIRDALAHHLHHAGLRAAIDDHRVQVRGGPGNSSTEQLNQPGACFFVDAVSATDYEQYSLGRLDLQSVGDLFCGSVRGWKNRASFAA